MQWLERVRVLVPEWRKGGRGGGWREGSPGRGAPRGRAALVFLHLNLQRNSGLGGGGLFERVSLECNETRGVQKACKRAHLHCS